MAQEVRFGATGFLVAIVVLFLGAMYFVGGGHNPFAKETAPAPTNPANGLDAAAGTVNGVPLSLVPQIEKTHIYGSTYDAADLADEGKETLVVGTVKVVKGKDVIETITTSASGGVASSGEYNGGDAMQLFGDASGYYAGYVDNLVIDSTNKPAKVEIRDSGLPTINMYTLKSNTNTTTVTLGTGQTSEKYYVELDSPGADTYFQLCKFAVNQMENESYVYFADATGAFDKGSADMDNSDVDRLQSAGLDRWWADEKVIRDFEQYDKNLIFKASDDTVNPGAATTTIYAIDCEWNLQNGVPVYSSETSANADVGEADLTLAITIA